MINWRLAVVMAERNISTKELAALIGMHPTSISKIKIGRITSNLDYLVKPAPA